MLVLHIMVRRFVVNFILNFKSNVQQNSSMTEIFTIIIVHLQLLMAFQLCGDRVKLELGAASWKRGRMPEMMR